MSTWPDTTGELDPPQDNRWRTARWLVGRYPRIQTLCERVGAVDDDDEGRWPHIDMLAHIIRASDAYSRAWDAYARAHYPPDDDVRYAAWADRGPKPADFADDANDDATPHGIHAFGVMSGGEKRLLRVLATLSPSRVEFSVDDTSGLDDEGHAFIRDWARTVLS